MAYFMQACMICVLAFAVSAATGVERTLAVEVASAEESVSFIAVLNDGMPRASQAGRVTFAPGAMGENHLITFGRSSSLNPRIEVSNLDGIIIPGGTSGEPSTVIWTLEDIVDPTNHVLRWGTTSGALAQFSLPEQVSGRTWRSTFTPPSPGTWLVEVTTDSAFASDLVSGEYAHLVAEGSGNQPPTASSFTVAIETSGQIGILLRGQDSDGDSLVYEIADHVGGGTLSQPVGAQVSYGAPAQRGTASFAYRAYDGAAWSAWATVTIRVGLHTQDQTDGLTPEQLVTSLLAQDAQVEISNVRYSGAAEALGFVTGVDNVFGIEQGLVLSTGAVSGLVGPNDDPGFSVDHYLPGDADLATLIESSVDSLHDAAVLEFDIVPQSSTFTFQYVLASEEYPEFLSFNDVFGFFVNGVNYATVNGEVVSVSSINHTSSLKAFYVGNWDPETGQPGIIDTQMDGMTVVLQFTAPVIQGELNTIKLAIADYLDTLWDSNIIIAAGSLTTDTADLDLQLQAPSAVEIPGDAFTAVLTLRNSGPDPLDNATVLFPVPEGSVYQSHAIGNGSYDPATGWWTLTNVPVNSSVSLSLGLGTANAGAVVLDAEIITAGAIDPDSTPGNGILDEDDQVQQTVVVGQP